jgi:hypothetical protein
MQRNRLDATADLASKFADFSMADSEKSKATAKEADELAISSTPLVFISHDSRDAELAEALANCSKASVLGCLNVSGRPIRKAMKDFSWR